MAAARKEGHLGERTALAVLAWAERDATRALHPSDREAIRSTEAARSLVLDLFAANAPARDLFNACARLGGLLAEGGASPSLAAGTIEGAARALEDGGLPFDPSRLAAARASLVEGYVAAVRDAERAASLASWEYPACAVPLEGGAVAIACGYPEADGEALAAWAARVAGRLVKAKVSRVVLSGADAARDALASAVELVGIAVVAPATDAGPQESKGWLRLPWRK